MKTLGGAFYIRTSSLGESEGRLLRALALKAEMNSLFLLLILARIALGSVIIYEAGPPLLFNEGS